MAPFTATPHLLKRDLKVIGQDLREVLYVGIMLQDGFAYASFIHSSEPLTRAASESAALLVVLIEEPLVIERALSVVAKGRAVIFLLDGDCSALAELQEAGAIVLQISEPAILQATVASLLPQLAAGRPA